MYVVTLGAGVRKAVNLMGGGGVFGFFAVVLSSKIAEKDMPGAAGSRD